MKCYLIRNGTILQRAGNKEKYLVAQVRVGIYMIISSNGNRWTDHQLTLKTLPKFIKEERFKVLNHGGLK